MPNLETVTRVTRVPVATPEKLPATTRKIKKLLVIASTRIHDDMFVKDYKRIIKAQNELTEIMVTALLIHLKREHGVDIPARVPNWRTFDITATGGWKSGSFTIIETLHDERAAPRRTGQWTVPKSVLIKEMGTHHG